ncbi:hypothetical protein EVG20_g10898 [Dentipellis fragilis]|uniref:Enoyl reductase (ER) domain-containing protein n=1 Tax=Dentipellis fragilis TaxID=205917 RepID=A0A4Y9XQK5_9AGAM|nr:hypothetical protein EVG20_g10898 [Dentipellis fragilis]
MLFTAFQALVLCAGIKEGDNVLIHAGASGVGIAAIQLARKYGAKTVTATASTKEKLDWLLSIPNGATHVANYKTQDFAEEVKKTTGGKGVDVVIDFVGQSHWQKNIDSMALDARMTILATLSGAEVPSFNLSPILYKRLRIQGSTLRSRSPEYQTDLIARFAKDILGHITGETGDGQIRVYIHKVYPWTDIQAATTEMEANKNSGKIIAEIVCLAPLSKSKQLARGGVSIEAAESRAATWRGSGAGGLPHLAVAFSTMTRTLLDPDTVRTGSTLSILFHTQRVLLFSAAPSASASSADADWLHRPAHAVLYSTSYLHPHPRLHSIHRDHPPIPSPPPHHTIPNNVRLHPPDDARQEDQFLQELHQLADVLPVHSTSRLPRIHGPRAPAGPVHLVPILALAGGDPRQREQPARRVLLALPESAITPHRPRFCLFHAADTHRLDRYRALRLRTSHIAHSSTPAASRYQLSATSYHTLCCAEANRLCLSLRTLRVMARAS